VGIGVASLGEWRLVVVAETAAKPTPPVTAWAAFLDWAFV